MEQIGNPFAILPGLDGRLLNSGKVYIGVENADPETNPKAVFWDIDGTIPATQPLRTTGGYIYHNGTPAIPYTDGSYSIRIRTAADELVFYEPSIKDAAEQSGAYQPTDATLPPVENQTKLGRIPNLRDDFGFVPDADTTGIAGAAALLRFSAWAQAESDAGRGVTIDVPPGTYYWNHQYCYGWMLGIKRLHMRGIGTPVFQNTYNPAVSGANFAFELPWGNGASCDDLNNAGALLAAGIAGQPTAGYAGFVTMTNPADYSRFAVGDWVIFGQGDIQSGVGSPPNMDYFQMAQVASMGGAPGTLRFNVPVQRDLLTDLPEIGAAPHWGKARVWNLKSGGGKTWDIDHLFEDLQINSTPNQTFTYFTVSGRKTTFRRCTIPGVSQSVAAEVVLEDVTMTTTGEPDKLVEYVLYDRVRGIGMDFQSSSIKKAVIRDSVFQDMLLGNAQDLLLENSTVDSLAQGETYGMGRRHTLRNSTARVTSNNFGKLRVPGSVYTVLDATASYANGRFTIKQTNPVLYPHWNTVTGMSGYFAMPEGYPTDPFHFTITKQTGDATNVYWDTDCYMAAPPAGSTGIYLQRAADLVIENCGGCDELRMASEARDRGFKPWERSRTEFKGLSAAGGVLNTLAQTGRLVRLTIDVKSAAPAAEAVAGLDLTQYNVQLLDMTNPVTLALHINTKTRGKRTYTLDGITGLAGLDTITLDAAPITALPADRWYTNDWNWAVTGYNPLIYAAWQLPVIEIIFEYDTGRGRKVDMGATVSINGGNPG